MNKANLASLLLAASLAACSGGGADSITPTTAATTASAPQASGRIAFSDPTFSVPSFNSTTENESGTCATSIQFTGAQSNSTSEYATLTVSEQGYNGAFTVAESFGNAPGNAGYSSPSQVLTSAVLGSTLTVTAIAAGLVNVAVSDSLGHSATCAVSVTTTTATADGVGGRHP